MVRFTLALVAALLLLVATPAAPEVTATRITCATTATVIYANDSAVAWRVLVRNPNSTSIFVGPSNLTSSTGFEVIEEAAIAVVLEAGDTLYCITASGTSAVQTLASRY